MSSRLSVKSVFAKIRKEEWIRRTEPIPKWNILRGDTVFLRSGKDKGVWKCAAALDSLQESRNAVI